MAYFAPTSKAGVFLQRELDLILPKLYTEKYPALWGADGSIIPASQDLPMGTENVVEQMLREYGDAKFYTDGTVDIPAADVGVSESTFKVFLWASRFQTSYLEIEKAMMAKKPIRELRAKAATKALLEKFHRYALVGRPESQAYGLLNQPTVGLTISAYNPLTATAQQHVDFVADTLQLVSDTTEMTEAIDTLLVPSKLLSIWARTILPNTAQNVLTYIKENLNQESVFQLRRIQAINEARAANLERLGVNAAGTNRDRLVFLSSSPEIMERKYFAPISTPPQPQGLEWQTFSIMGSSELILHYPGAMRYVEIAGL